MQSAWRIWQTSPYRYSKLAAQLPVLITDVDLPARRHQPGHGYAAWQAVQCCAADLYGLLRTVAKRLGRVDLALLVADRAIRAAEAADAPHRVAAARWNLGHVLLADRQPEGAETVAMLAATSTRRRCMAR